MHECVIILNATHYSRKNIHLAILKSI